MGPPRKHESILRSWKKALEDTLRSNAAAAARLINDCLPAGDALDRMRLVKAKILYSMTP